MEEIKLLIEEMIKIKENGDAEDPDKQSMITIIIDRATNDLCDTYPIMSKEILSESRDLVPEEIKESDL